MKKIFILLLVLSTTLFAYTSIKELNYESGISIYGKIGTVSLTLEENHTTNKYKMVAKTMSTGVVKYLSGNRIDTFTSEGSIKNGVYLPHRFIRHTSKYDSNKTRTYNFNYENKTVEKIEVVSKLESFSGFDPISFNFTEEEKIVTSMKKKEIDFEENDFLSLYLNLIKGNLQKGKVPYIDMKEEDTLLYIKTNLFEVHKNHGEDQYSIVMVPDTNSIFFNEVKSVGIAFYGDAYIKKTSEITKTRDE